MADMTYAVHTATCTYLLDDDGICVWTLSPSAAAPGADRCMGAQFVACLDLTAPGGLVGELRLGASALFVRREHGKFVLLRTAAIEHVEYREQTDEEVRAHLASIHIQDATAVLTEEIDAALPPPPAAHADNTDAPAPPPPPAYRPPPPAPLPAPAPPPPRTPPPPAPPPPRAPPPPAPPPPRTPPPPAPPPPRDALPIPVDTNLPPTEPLPAQALQWAVQQSRAATSRAQRPPDPWEAPQPWGGMPATGGGLPAGGGLPPGGGGLPIGGGFPIGSAPVAPPPPLHLSYEAPESGDPLDAEDLMSISVTEVTLTMPLYRDPGGAPLPAPAPPPRPPGTYAPAAPEVRSGDAGPPTPRGPPPERRSVVGPGKRLR